MYECPRAGACANVIRPVRITWPLFARHYTQVLYTGKILRIPSREFNVYCYFRIDEKTPGASRGFFQREKEEGIFGTYAVSCRKYSIFRNLSMLQAITQTHTKQRPQR